MSVAKLKDWIAGLLHNDNQIREIYISTSTNTCNTLNYNDEYTDIEVIPDFAGQAILQIIDLPSIHELIDHAIQKRRHWITSGEFADYGFTYSIHNNGKTSFTIIINPL